MSLEGSLSENPIGAPSNKTAIAIAARKQPSPLLADTYIDTEFFRGRRNQTELEHVGFHLDDEHNSTPTVEIDILQPVILEVEDRKGQKITEDLTNRIRSEFEYLSATKSLEINSPRVAILQNYVNRMVENNQQWENKVRVVIMNKGQTPKAFVYPDGTIFVSQFLINLCDSLDETVSILAHEIKHLTNGTYQAAFKSAAQQGTSLGIDWLHEMVSDFGAPELLEQAGLKSTASVNLFTKLANHVGNRRGIAHQAPLLRAIQQLGIHTIKDYATSHISYTPLPLELKRAPRMTNFEAITDAAVKDDTESVALYLAKLHPRDLGQFFEIIDANSYYDLSKFSPKRETKREIAARVKVLVNQRLVSEGMSENEIKLFFLSTTRNGSLLSPTFKNVAEVESCAALAEQMFQKKTVNNATQKLFGRNRNSDPLENLVHFVQYRFDDFTDKNAVFLTDVDSIAQFIGTVNKLIKGELPQVKEGYFIDLEGGVSKHAYNRSAQIHEDLKYILFGYIERYYLSDIPDGELDQEQIENIFQAVKSAGFEYLPNSYYFPILEENIGPANRQIIESAYSKVYGRELVRHSSGKDIEPLPTPADFRNQIKGKSPMDIIRLLNRHARNYELDLETKAQYVQAGLEYFEEYDFTRSHLAALIKNQIGNETMGNWQKYEDPKWNTTDSIRTNPEDSFTGTSRQEEKSHPRKLTLDDLIQEFGLDHTTLYAEARRKGEIERISSEIKFVADTIASSEETLFDFVESIMRNIRTDIKTLDQYQLLAICRPLFMLASKEEGGTTSEEDRIRDFDRFYQLRLIQEIVQRIENVRFENVQDLSSYIRETKRKYSQSPTNIRFALYEDSVYSVLLAKPVRDELRRLTEPGNLRHQDYPVLLELLNENFPDSPQKRELIKALQTAHINNPDISIEGKIDFFSREYKSLGYEGAVLIAEQITDTPTYQAFKQRLDQLAIEHISGEESLNGVAATDIASSVLNQKADLLVKTASGSSRASREVSTDLAIAWVKTYLCTNNWRNHNIRYDEKSGKFILTEVGKSAFAAYIDAIDYFQNLPDSKKLAIALKTMSDENGLLVSDKGRNLLEKILVGGLGLKEEFFRAALSSAIRKGSAEIVGLPTAQLLVPFMFRALNAEAVDLRKVRNVRFEAKEEDKSVYKKVGDTDYSQDLPRILGSNTDALRYFGFRYRLHPNSIIGRQAQDSNSVYFETLNSLTTQIVSSPELNKTAETSSLSSVTEAMIKAGETSPVFVRGMQMAVQLINFEPAVHERLSQTQDSMKGVKKLHFWDNLLSMAQRDPELSRFLEQNLISLDSYLGGGCLFTTYGATIRNKAGLPRKVVIKILNPNAEEFVRLSYTFSSTVLDEVEQNTKGKTRQHARLARSLLDLSYNWCLQDINDPVYARLDDIFRLTIQKYAENVGEATINAPERLYTSQKVRIEDQCEGTTLNKFLADPNVTDEKKQETVDHLLRFFNYQFDFSPTTSHNGDRVFVFHSDPHTGNYIINPKPTNQKLGVIDRSMYIALEERDVEMFKLLKVRNNTQFINGFIERCLEINGIGGKEAKRIRYRIFSHLSTEFIRQSIGRRTDATAYLQIVMREFSKYGERYFSFENPEIEQSTLESKANSYFRNNPEADTLYAYDALKKQLVNGKNEATLTYQQFTELLKEMQKKGFLRKKAIEVPIEYRLMIRNIIVMQNLQQRWLKR